MYGTEFNEDEPVAINAEMQLWCSQLDMIAVVRTHGYHKRRHKQTIGVRGQRENSFKYLLTA